MAALVDTNVLVSIFDPADPHKQRVAAGLLEQRLPENSLKIPHQAIVEFVAATTRPRTLGRNQRLGLLTREAAYREAEELLSLFEILYPNESVVRTR